jgi:hypothetical protein
VKQRNTLHNLAFYLGTTQVGPSGTRNLEVGTILIRDAAIYDRVG